MEQRKRLKNQIRDVETIVHGYSRKACHIPAAERRNEINSTQTRICNMINGYTKSVLPFKNNTSDILNQHFQQFLINNISSKTRSSDNSANDKKKKKNTENKILISAKNTSVSCAKDTKDTRNTRKKYVSEVSNPCLEKNARQPKPEKNVSTNPVMVCKFCNKKFRLRKSYWAHIRTHSGEKSYTCHICGKQFVQGGSLYYHLKHVHDGVKNHTCDICGRSFAMKTAMEDHRRIHTGERPFVCHACGKTFKTKASLYIHSKTHTDEFPHKCTYCAKKFRWRQQMLGHLTVHTGEKNHTCDICGKGFGVKNDLTRHKRVHSEEKPYTCQQCGISFGQKRYLKSHERLKLGMCGYSRSSSRGEIE